MRVIVYEPRYSRKQQLILRQMVGGIKGAELQSLEDFVPGEADVAVVFGWYKLAWQPTMAKWPIIVHPGHRLLIIESAFQLRKSYYQVGWGGFAGHADFRTDGVPDDRWRVMGIPTRPWQHNPDGPIVVIGQLPHDTQVQDVDHVQWCQDTVRYFQDAGQIVRFRPHPRIKDSLDYGIPEELWDQGKLRLTLKRAQAVVTWNSTTGVDAAIAGVPVVALDRGSMAWPVASHELAGAFVRPDRAQWFAALGYSQWTPSEMLLGKPWEHLNR